MNSLGAAGHSLGEGAERGGGGTLVAGGTGHCDFFPKVGRKLKGANMSLAFARAPSVVA